MVQKIGLGKGLDSLIPLEETLKEVSLEKDKEGFLEIEVDKISPNPNQPRKNFKKESLEELANSIRSHGILEPLIVREKEESGYELVIGERRLRAAKMVDLQRVPAVIKKLTDKQCAELSLIENIQRDDLNAIEKAHAYKKILEGFGLTQEHLARHLGMQRSAIANTLRLLKLSSFIQEAIINGIITEGHARAVLSLESAEDRKILFDKILKMHFSVRQAESTARRLCGKSGKGRLRIAPKTQQEFIKCQEALEQKFKVPVKIRAKNKGGSIIIKYRDIDELNRIVETIG